MASMQSMEYKSPYQGEKFEELLKCPMCLEVYSSPRAMTCLHTFCEHCISSYIESITSGKYPTGNIPCPTCRQITRLPDTAKSTKDWGKLLPYNYTILPLIEAYNNKIESTKKNVKNCVSCSGTVTKFFAVCEDCGGSLCSKCTSLHSELKLFKNHDIISISLDSDHGNCTQHVDKKLDYICTKHNELLCSTCVVANHRACEEIRELKDIVTKDRVKVIFLDVKGELEALQTFLSQSINDVLTENDHLKVSAAVNDETIENFKEQIDNMISKYKRLQVKSVQDNEEKTEAYFIQCQKTLSKVQKIEKILDLLESSAQKTSLFLALRGFSSELQDLRKDIMTVKGAGKTVIKMPAELESLINITLQSTGNALAEDEQLKALTDKLSSTDGKADDVLDPASEIAEAAEEVATGGIIAEVIDKKLSHYPTQEASGGTVSQQVLWVEEHEKQTVLLKHLSKLGQGSLAIIYVETKAGACSLKQFLLSKNYPAASIHGSNTPIQRDWILKSFSSRQKTILVTTTFAAKGADVPNVQLVVNFDLPSSTEEYISRISKVDQTTNTGQVTSFFNEKNKHLTRDLIHVLVDDHQDVPSWLEAYANRVHPPASVRQRFGAYQRSTSSSIQRPDGHFPQNGYYGNQLNRPGNPRGENYQGNDRIWRWNQRNGNKEFLRK